MQYVQGRSLGMKGVIFTEQGEKFQIALIGTFLLVIFMSLLMVLHYLDKRRDAMIACAVLTVCSFRRS